MPQIILGRNYGGNVGMGASDLQSAAFLKAIERSQTENDRADAGLAKAKSFMQKYNMAVGSEITSADGVTNNNALVDRRVKPQTENLSRAAGGQMKQVITKTAAQKNLEGLNILDGIVSRYFDKKDDDKIRDDIYNAKTDFSSMGNNGLGGGGNLGPGGGSTTSTSSKSLTQNMTESSGFNTGSFDSAKDSYFLNSDYNQRFDDRFGYDTNSARMLADLEGISAAYAGQEYDPSKDVYLTGALNRDKDNAAANLNDFNQNMLKRTFVDGDSFKFTGPSTNNSFSIGKSEQDSKSTSTSLPGVNKKDTVAYLSITRPGPNNGKMINIPLEAEINPQTGVAEVPIHKKPVQYDIDVEVINDALRGINITTDSTWFGLAGNNPINSYADIKKNSTYFDEDKGKLTKKGVEITSYAMYKGLMNTPLAPKDWDMKTNQGEASFTIWDPGLNKEVNIQLYQDGSGLNYKYKGRVSTAVINFLSRSVLGDKVENVEASEDIEDNLDQSGGTRGQDDDD